VSRYAVAKLFGQEMGVIAETENGIAFQYSDTFEGEKLPVSPVRMPYDPHKIYGKYDAMAFDGLPGIFNDSLPDSFGTLLMNEYLANRFGHALQFSVIDKLLYVGSNGIGAIEYFPALEDVNPKGVVLREYIDAARDVMRGKESDVLAQISRYPSPGGARPKAAVKWNRKKNLMIVGEADGEEDMEAWIVKFDEEGKETTKIEYCYMTLAKDAGIDVPPVALIPSGQEYHFGIKRFDRKEGGKKLHLATLSGLMHINHHHYHVSTSYERCIKVGVGITQTFGTAEEIFRRMVFNVVGRNCDDHAKNTSFLMDEDGVWRLSPAYDIVYNFGPATFGRHRMSVANKTEEITIDDVMKCGYEVGLRKRFMDEVVERTNTLFANIEKRLMENGVSRKTAGQMQKNINILK